MLIQEQWLQIIPELVSDLIDKKGVMIGPGAGYGKYGEGYLRFSITQNEEKIKEGMERFLDYLEGR